MEIRLVGSTNFNISSFKQEVDCSKNSENVFLSQTEVRSKLECAAQCQLDERCQRFRHTSYNGTNETCDLFASTGALGARLSQFTPLGTSDADESRCYQRNNATPSAPQGDVENLIHATTDSVNEPTTSIQNSQWTLFTDSNEQTTYSESYISSNQHLLKETKSLIYHDQGNASLYRNTFFRIVQNVLHTYMAYSMSKLEGSFSQDSELVVHDSWYNGHHETTYDTKAEYFVKKTKTMTRIKIFTENEYALHFEATPVNVPMLVACVRAGFKIFNYKYAKVWNDDTAVSLYNIDERMESQGLDYVQISVHQQLHVVPLAVYTMRVNVGDPSGIVIDEAGDTNATIFISTHWKQIDVNSLTQSEVIEDLNHYLFHGHAFRVGFEDDFFDVDSVLRFNDEFLFFLPQQADVKSLDKFTSGSHGLRAAVSLNGRLSWCTHPFQGEDVIDSAQDLGLQVLPIADNKTWTLVLAVYSNSTVLRGHVSTLIDDLLKGKDVGVVIQWLVTDMARRLTISSFKINNLNTSNVEVSGESKASWQVEDTEGKGQFVLGKGCNLQKFLVRTTGYVEQLTYNVKFRSPQQTINNVISFWYSH